MSRRFTKIPSDTFKKLVLGAGILCENFNPDPAEGEANVPDEDILGATSGGVNFSASATYIDLGKDVDNCAKNTVELKILDSWDVKISGTLLTVNAKMAALMAAAADVGEDGVTVTPRNVLKISDFIDKWYVCDYGVGGMLAIHVLNALSTGGFSIKTGDREKGQFPFEFTGHQKMAEQDKPPFELFISPGEEEPTTVEGGNAAEGGSAA